MHGSYRSIVAALIGWLILVGASPSPKQQADGKGTAPQAQLAEKPRASDLAVPVSSSGPSPDAGCERGKEDRKSDLCAQWKAADAAFDGARWAWWQLLLGVVGIALGAVTMIAAIAAAMYAKRAAVATEATVDIATEASKGATDALLIAERNANAAAEQVAVSERASKAQLRAYVTVTKAQLRFKDEQTLVAEVWCSNTGQTPAVNLNVAITGNALPGRNYGSDYLYNLVPKPHPSLSVIGKDAEVFFDQEVDYFTALRTDSVSTFVTGVLNYIDVFGDAHETRFCYVSNADTRRDGKDFVVAGTGNSMT